jgi:hypothetical protein
VLSRVREEDGFSLIEAAVAGSLLLIAIIGGIGVFDSSRRESATGERQQVAALHAQAEIERMRDVPYSDLGIDPAEGWQPSLAPGDPTNRVAGTTNVTFRAGESLTEDMAFFSENGKGIDPYSSSPIEVAGVPLDLNVYRFISWRDEECPVADLSGLTGSMEGLTDTTTGLLGTLLGGGSVLNQLLGPLLGILNPVIGSQLDELEATLGGVEDEVTELIDAVNGLEEVDPCDADVETLNEMEGTIGPLNPLLTQLDTRLGAYRAGCTVVLGVVVSCPGTGSALWTSLNSTITSIESGDFQSQIADLTTALDELELDDHTHNTKRVTVAVVLDPRTGSGPSKPVWATSFVSDPDEGLLAGP